MKKCKRGLIFVLLIFLLCLAAKPIFRYAKMSDESREFTSFSRKAEKLLKSKDIEMNYYESEASESTSRYWYQLKFPSNNIEECIEYALRVFNEGAEDYADLFYKDEKIRLVIFDGKINKSSCYEIVIKYNGQGFDVCELHEYPQDLRLKDYMSIKCFESAEALALSNVSDGDNLNTQMKQGIEKLSNLKSLSFFNSYVDLSILNNTPKLEYLKVNGGCIVETDAIKNSSALKTIELNLDNIDDEEKQNLLKIKEECSDKNIFINGKAAAQYALDT